MARILRLFAVDDTRTVHAFLRKCIEDMRIPFEMVTAKDGLEAVEMLAAPGSMPPDLIFLDWEMPRLDGPSTFARMREMGIASPVIMLTSKSDVADIAQMLEAGVAEYVMKPFTADIIHEKMALVLGVGAVAGNA